LSFDISKDGTISNRDNTFISIIQEVMDQQRSNGTAGTGER